MIHRSIAICSLAILLASCANLPKQPIRSVCVEIVGLPPHEIAFMIKRTAAYLSDYGIIQVSSGCDVSIRYQAFGDFQAEIIARIGKKGYWSQEGNVTISHLGKTIIEDEQIILRGYDSRQDILDVTAWLIVEPVTEAFRGEQPSEP